MANDYERDLDGNVFGGALGGRRSSVSAFSADGRGNFSRTYAGPETGGMAVRQEWGADYDDALAQRQVYEGMAQLGRRAAAVKRHNENLGNATILSAMKLAQSNNGRFPAYALDNAMRNLGMDGKTQAIGGMGYTQNGDFVIDILSPGQNGGVTRTPRVIKPREQYQMMLGGGGAIFSPQDMAAFRKSLMDNHGFADGELPAVPDFSNVSRGAKVRQAQSQDAQMAKFVMGVAQDVMKSRPRDAEGAIRQKLLMDDKFRAELMRGKPIMEEDGKTQKTDLETGEPMYEQATDEEMKQKLDRIVGLATGGQAQGAGQDEMARKMQFVNWLLDRLYPNQAPQDPRMAEVRSRQMDNALEDQLAADVRRRPQQIVDYIEDGVWKRGNGYVVDGMVYDVNGREIAGAQLADRNGNPILANPSTQDGQDGGALLRQMRDGQPPAAQGGELPPAQSLVNGGVGRQGAAASQGNRTLEELLRKRGYDPAKIAAAARGGERTQTVQGPDVGQEASSGNGEPPPSRPAREPKLSREEALAAEEERRARNGRQMAVMREAAQESAARKPLSQTRIADLPGAVADAVKDKASRVASGVGRALGKVSDDVADAEGRAVDAVRGAVDKGVSEMGEHVRGMANMTPAEIVKNAKNEMQGYKNAVSSFFGRIRRNLDEMDRVHREMQSSEKEKDRNRFYANRDGRAPDRSPEEVRRQQEARDRSQGDALRPRQRTATEWVRDNLDFFRKANGQDGEIAAAMKDLAGRGKDAALSVVRRMMEDDGVDTSDVTPDSPTGNAVFDKILEMTSPIHSLNAQRNRLKKQGN